MAAPSRRNPPALDGERRRYYQLTAAEAERLARAKRLVAFS